LNSLEGFVVGNAATVQAGTSGSLNVYASNPTDVVIDINGYYMPQSAAPHAMVISYSLANGASSSPITPPADQPVLIMGIQDQGGFRGVGQVTLLRVAGQFLEWVGLESTAGAAITQGFSSTPGTHILYLDFGHSVDLRVNDTDSFVVHNASGGLASGTVTLIW
jgi:hypothetical protein